MQSEGGMTDAEFQAAADSVSEGYLQQKQDLQIQAVQFQMDTIRQAYGDDLDQMIEEIKRIRMNGWAMHCRFTHPEEIQRILICWVGTL